MTATRICPLPKVWEGVRVRLEAARRGLPESTPPVPVPLILAAWQFSSDTDKQARWAETMAWAEKWGLASAIPDIDAADWYDGEDAS